MATHKGVFRLPRVRKFSGLSTTAIYAGAAKGTFPRPIKIGKRASAWLVEDLEEWLSHQASEARSNRV
jgi:prophage regulatory protein